MSRLQLPVRFGSCVVRLSWIRWSLLSFPVLDARRIQLRSSRAKTSPPFRKAAAQIIPDFFSQLCFGLDDFSHILAKRLDTYSVAVPKLAVSVFNCVQLVAFAISLAVNSASSVLFHRVQMSLVFLNLEFSESLGPRTAGTSARDRKECSGTVENYSTVKSAQRLSVPSSTRPRGRVQINGM